MKSFSISWDYPFKYYTSFKYSYARTKQNLLIQFLIEFRKLVLSKNYVIPRSVLLPVFIILYCHLEWLSRSNYLKGQSHEKTVSSKHMGLK
jgi:hypothetical protein